MIDLDKLDKERIFALFDRIDEAYRVGASAKLAQKVYDSILPDLAAHAKTGGRFEAALQLESSGDTHTIYHDLNAVPHALFVHEGTKEHPIPKPGTKTKILRFFHGNAVVFAKSVEHPGYKGDPYIDRAADKMPVMLDRIIDDITL
ncbi:head-to-tail connector protein [Caudoviricetes sp.]|nr:head-to-tail connector protein [Caudoviricetes sp.]